ncbi:MAG TPA: sulfite exporter TauE/SafE family protein, partial [Candidatus Eremiobacteraceae bacterium]|nr:sulfite exporter TauE/SafE family protein [Candidatus Eremiobacteraceae bacterium]
ALSLVAGFISTLFGLGGGLIYMPAMVSLFAFPAHVATATSFGIIALTTLFGTASHMVYGDVRWDYAIPIAIGAVIGAQIGARLSKRVSPTPLLRLLAVAVFVTAAELVWSAFT